MVSTSTVRFADTLGLLRVASRGTRLGARPNLANLRLWYSTLESVDSMRLYARESPYN